MSRKMKQKSLTASASVQTLKRSFRAKELKTELTDEEIRIRLRAFFRHHIGKDNAATSRQVYAEIYRVDPALENVFARTYRWGRLQSILKQMKSELFVVTHGLYYHYILKTKDECAEYHRVMDRVIANAEQSKKSATEWVRRRTYERL